jgi:hypothetical protein
MGYGEKHAGHGFRALAMGVIKDKLDYAHEVVNRQLAHIAEDPEGGAYGRGLFLAARAKTMQAYADCLDSVFEANADELKKWG